MSKYGMSPVVLSAKKSSTFMDKVHKWTAKLSGNDRRQVYYDLLLYASEQIPLIHQDEVIQKAQDLYYEIKQRER